MKLSRIIVVQIILLLLALPSYGSSYNIEGLSTDRPTYHRGDLVTITGTLKEDGEPKADVYVSIEVYGPDGTVWVDAQKTDEQGKFTSSFRLASDAKLGNYTVYATYLGVVKSVSFFVEAKTIPLTTYTFELIWEDRSFLVEILSNSTISSFEFSQPNKQVSFNVSGEDGTRGLAKVTLPKELLSGQLTVFFDDEPIEFQLQENSTHSFITISYTHGVHQVKVQGTVVIPEFHSGLLVLVLTIFISLLVLRQNRRVKDSRPWSS